jgi:hypothetical protein
LDGSDDRIGRGRERSCAKLTHDPGAKARHNGLPGTSSRQVGRTHRELVDGERGLAASAGVTAH